MWYLTSHLGTIRPLPCLFRRALVSLVGALMISMFISHDLRAQASVVTGSNATSATSYSVGGGSNRVLVVSITEENNNNLAGRTISTVTWGSQSLTFAAGVYNGGSSSNDLRTEVWYLKDAGISAAASACNNIVVTWSGGYSPSSQVVTAFTLKDVDQTTPVAATNTAAPATSGTTVTLPATAAGINDIVCYASGTRGNDTHTAATGYTELIDYRTGATAEAVAYKQITTAGNETPQATWSSSQQLTLVGVVFNGVTATSSSTFYSRASGDWNANTSWSYSSDGSSGAVPSGVWPGRFDNVVIGSGHTITIDDTDDNKACGISPDALGRSNVGPVASIPMFYQIGDILVNGTLTVSGVEIMVEGYTRLTSGSTCNLGSTMVNLGYLEVDASATMSGLDDLILTGNSNTIINTSSTLADDLIIDYTNASLCGTGTTALTTNGGSRITYLHSATVAQICTTFQVTCPNGGCNGGNPGFPTSGTGSQLVGNGGPGGVGNSTNNKLWLKANDLSLANNAAVTSWADASGNSLTATATGATTTRPTFNTNAVNTTLPSISFDGGDFLNLGTPTGLNFVPRTDNWSFICAFNVNTGSSGTFLSKATSDDNSRQYQYTIDSSTPNRYTAFMGGDFHTGAATATGAWTVGMSTTSTNATTGFNTYLNGTADLTGETVGAGSTQGTDVLIGARRNNSATDFGFPLTGRIAEIAMYNAVLNTAQRMIITNYLAAKYAITLVAANDMYTMDNAGNGNFDFDVAGIGQAADGSNHRDARGSGIVRMWNPSGMGNGEYLMWGHDGTILYSSTSAGVSAPIEERLSRTWRVSETGDVGTVSVSFDLSLLGTPLGSNLRLLIDRNGNGFADNDVTPITGSFVGNTVVFSAVNFQDGDRFTLGNTDIDDPLPIELVRFRAVAEERTVRLSWATASETNNDFFTVERSRDAQQWETVQRIPGAGTSKVMNYYETVDDGPYRGASYYRLKQTDFDLQSKHSDLVRVVVDHETPITLHPNPFHDHVRLLIDFEPEQSEVKLYNANGAEIPFTMKKEGTDLVINPGNIPRGVYILKVLDRFVIRTAKLIKR